MLVTAAASILGIFVAGTILVLTSGPGSETAEPKARPTALGWLVLAFGLVGASAFVLGMVLPVLGPGVYLTSMASAFIVAIIGIGAIRRGERYWPTWVGLAGGSLPIAFWLAFALGHLVAFLLGIEE